MNLPSVVSSRSHVCHLPVNLVCPSGFLLEPLFLSFVHPCWLCSSRCDFFYHLIMYDFLLFILFFFSEEGRKPLILIITATFVGISNNLWCSQTILSVNVAFLKGRGAGNSSIADCWPSIHKALGSTPSTAKSKMSDHHLAFAWVVSGDRVVSPCSVTILGLWACLWFVWSKGLRRCH